MRGRLRVRDTTGVGCMSDEEGLVQRVRVTLVVPLLMDPDGTLRYGEVIRVPQRSGRMFRTWDQMVELIQSEACRDLPLADRHDQASW